MSYLFPDNHTAKPSKLTLDRLQSILRTTAGTRYSGVLALQTEVSILLDYITGLLHDEACYQKRLNILPEVAALEGKLVEGKVMPSYLATLPLFDKNGRPTALASLKVEDPTADLSGSNNVIIKDPQVVLAMNQMMAALVPVYKHIKLHEHRIRNAMLTLQTKLMRIEQLQNEVGKLSEGTA